MPPFATPDQPFVLTSAFAYQVAFFNKEVNNKGHVLSPSDGKVYVVIFFFLHTWGAISSALGPSRAASLCLHLRLGSIPASHPHHFRITSTSRITRYGKLDTSRPQADALRAHAEEYCGLDLQGRSSQYKDSYPYNVSRCFDLLYVARLMKAYRLDTLTGPPPAVEASDDYGWTLGAAVYLNREIPINTDVYTETRMSWEDGVPLIVALGLVSALSACFLVFEMLGTVKGMKQRNDPDDGIPYHAQVDPIMTNDLQ
jgi:hypothetical protein